ncbi:rhamnan synthesis F family protein [Salinivibrio kushneri]|uniref:rhamnan synthesis F family protein n=1 Tax=Salinivibrio kushneri TaxID=1908198 RepID=UPI0022B3D552|nr:rhamnan synthesis F family protein [Salinivibrio kushneri]WBA17118.1 glycosyl transferase family 1 [Salinivibrio kushneri]
MNYRAMIKQRFPGVERTLRSRPLLMKLAVNVEHRLLQRQAKKLSKRYAVKGSAMVGDYQQLLAEAKQHGLFDFEWYCHVQNRRFSTEQEAFSDYLYKSRFSAVSPSPRFSNLTYQKCNLAVYHANVSPLVHYLQSGDEEGRVCAPFAPTWKPTQTLAIAPKPEQLQRAKIAVCLHVFYADFIPYYARCLRDFPAQVDLFISVSDRAFRASVDEHLAPLNTVQNIEVVEVPNRGRNFGPMLVEFGRKLLDYDLFCHLHSKKSLYSGRPQTQWADYLGEYLLHDHIVVAKAITHMLENAQTGVYYPTAFPMMPDWVNHWLKNKPFKSEFFNAWDLQDHAEFLAYPVGGMFWAKPDALRPLLEKKYQYSDFPEEPLPNDGSSLHALERCIGLLAERRGYSQLFFHPELASFTHDKSYIFANYVSNPQQLRDKVQPFDIISFDVFDTLVRRSHQVPDYAKLKLGQYLVDQGYVCDAKGFVELRNRAEFLVGEDKQFQGDVTIYEVYQKLANMQEWSEQQAQHYADLEFAYDLEMIESKDEMVAILNQLIDMGKTVYIISDTYYTDYQIILMLRKAGVTNGYRLYTSAETGQRKDNGTMWAYISQSLKDKSRFVHIGDNAVADAQIPGDFGLANLHILNPMDKWQAAGWENPFANGNELNEQQILKWGPLISQFGRFPFLGE